MATHHVVRPDEVDAFETCRRQWDFHSRERQSLERVAPATIERALRDALDVWYFPGMWGFGRAVVNPLAREAFARAVGDRSSLDPIEAEAIEHGESLLDRYFAWAAERDTFTPIRTDAEIDVLVPTVDSDDLGLVAADGRGVRFRARPDLVVTADNGDLWLVEHRFVKGDWPPENVLRLDPWSATYCWAWASFELGMEIEGTIYNQVRVAAPSWPTVPGSLEELDRPTAALDDPDELFRRTATKRSLDERLAARERLVRLAIAMTDPEASVDPSPAPARCTRCAFLEPCAAIEAGEDPGPLLDVDFRQRPPERLPGRVGHPTWSIGRGARPPELGA